MNFGLLAQGSPRFVPCTPLGIRELLLHAGVETRGAHAVVLGRSQLVGKPMALLLMQKGPGGDATVTVCHTATRDAAAFARQADILVVAMGRPEQVTADWVKPGAVVIDVGIHQRDDGTLCGDVDFAGVSAVASRITPVPGGVGPMTVAMLLRNTLLAARLSTGAEAMIKLGICNELFEGWEFGRVCRTVKEIGYDGLEIAPFTLAPPDRRPEPGTAAGAEGHGRGRGPRDDRPALAPRQDRGVLPHVARRSSPARDGRLPQALAEATRDLGGSLMVLGSPKQRDLLPGVTYDQAVDYAIDVFERSCPPWMRSGSTSAWSRWRPPRRTSSTPAPRRWS